jgi:hypothetical protein
MDRTAMAEFLRKQREALLGTLAAGGLVLYCLGALFAHLRVGSRKLVGWAVFFSTVVAALAVNLGYQW